MRTAVRGGGAGGFVKGSRDIDIVAIDSGFATLGLCHASGDPELTISNWRVHALEFYSTKKASKPLRRKIRVSTDDRTRVEQLTDVVLRRIQQIRPVAVVVEWYVPGVRAGGAQTGVAGWKAAITVGAIIGIARSLNLPVLDQLPLDKRSLGKEMGHRVKSGGKDDVEAWLRQFFPGFSEAIDPIARSHREHPVDAGAHAAIAMGELAERRRAAAL